MTQPHFLDRVFEQSALSREELDQIIPHFKRVEFAKEDYLLQDGQTARNYWFVEQGFLRSYVVNTDGQDITTHFYAKGDIVIDWPSFFLRTPTREYIQALTPCMCWELDFDTFQQLFHEIKNFR